MLGIAVLVPKQRNAAVPGIGQRHARLRDANEPPARQLGARQASGIVAGELGEEAVLLEDLGFAAAPRAVELGDDRAFVLDAVVVDTILVAVQCKKTAVAVIAEVLKRLENVVRLQVGVGLRFAVGRHRSCLSSMATSLSSESLASEPTCSNPSRR